MANRTRIFISIAFNNAVLSRALRVAIIVGVILNAINQGDKFLILALEQVNWVKFLLTFIVPYLVSTYSSALSKMNFSVGDVAPMSAVIKCLNGAHKSISINKGDVVPQCPECGSYSKWKLVRLTKAQAHSGEEDFKSMALFAELNPAPVFRFSAKGLVLEANLAARNTFRDQNIVGNNIQNYLKHLNLDYGVMIEKGEILTHFEQIDGCFFRFELRGVPKLGVIQTYGADITEVKQKDLESKKYLQAIEQTESSIMITDVDGNIEFVNKGFELKSGYLKEEVIGLNPKILKTDYLPAETYRKMWETISAGKVWTGEFHNKRKDGSIYWEEATISPIKGSDGGIINYMAVKEDVTERKKQSEAIQSMAMFARLNPEPVFRFNCEGVVVESNPAANVAFLRESIIKLNAKELLPELDHVNIKALIDNAQILTVEEIIGERIFRFILRGLPELHMCQIYGSDVTLRRKAEQEVRLQKQNIENSIVYASRIQNAVLPSAGTCADLLPKSFVLFKPRDIVSGDFYWITQIESKKVVVAADCTGHGVPGAFMSMLGVSFLNEIVNRSNVLQANEILNQLRKNVKETLSQTGRKDEAKDGMDMALCIIDEKAGILEYSGAYNPLYIIRKGELTEIKADRNPIGIHLREKSSFTNHIVNVEQGDVFYIFSDGYIDQFGGDRQEKFKSVRFKELLLDIHREPMLKQKEILDQKLNEWKGENHQVDDVIVLGFQVK